MPPVFWTTQINFASALLLHSCLTVIFKEISNLIEISRRLAFHFWASRFPRKSSDRLKDQIKYSIVLDAYTSIFSHDLEGELAELYFTNTGFILLAISLASSVAMNLLLSDMLLNIFVATTFSVAFLASLVNGEKEITLPIMALRRAARFIWADTPFVNFFSLIYIATVLRGVSMIRLQDYIAFRGIAVLELVFMKAKLAASSPEKQIALLRQLVDSEWVATNIKQPTDYINQPFPIAKRNKMIPFTTAQRLSVMLFKTSISHHLGCLHGSLGPATCPVPRIGQYIAEPEYGWRIYRVSDDIMLLSDCLVESCPKGRVAQFVLRAHGVLLRQLGKVRVIYLLRTRDLGAVSVWHSNVNLVTGVSRSWLDGNFQAGSLGGKGVIAG